MKEGKKKEREGKPTKNRISLPILILRVRTDERAKVIFLDFVFVPISNRISIFCSTPNEELDVKRED